ncbi:MAG: type II toxin-antitoxin system RelE/ParE family toxin [Bacteroidetes bacterium]|nr:type II toxin-antitoxin system RelE/ParE family toxin [Bacteroidota bacterium]
MKVEWTDRAKKDLRKLFDYYKDDAQNVVAKSVTNHIVRQSMLLESLPLLGLVEPELEGKKEEYRSLILGNQKIIYWIEGSRREKGGGEGEGGGKPGAGAGRGGGGGKGGGGETAFL